MRRPALTIALLALTAFAAGIALSVLRDPPAAAVATVFGAPRGLPAVALSDQHGEPLTRERFADGWDILFFGFTHCPDICPTTLFRLAGLRDRLADLPPGRRPRVWLVSVDPQRDTPAVLARYLQPFGAGFAGATGSIGEIDALASGLGVAYRQVPEGDSYTVSHTAALFLVDPGANLVALFSAPHDFDAIEADYRLLTR